MDDQNTPVVEAEIEETDVTVTSPSGDNQATVLLSLEEMIKKNITSIDKLRSELKKHGEMYEDSFLNSETYRDHTEKAKEANKVKNATRKQIASQPAVIQLAMKIKDMRTDLKERQFALSDYLQEYQRMTGATEIEDEDGQIREIVNSAKLVKRTANVK